MTRRERWRQIIFEADTPEGKNFDVLLIACILISVLVAMLSSVPTIHASHGTLLWGAEWFFTVVFTLEYAARLWSVESKWKYATSFFGMVDLISILPTYAMLIFPEAQYFIVLRALRVMRIFRVLKLFKHLEEANRIVTALRASRDKIFVFLFAVMIVVSILGSMVYLVEGEENGFTSIPKSIYWAIVTLTTVGYGDMAPRTPLGQLLACVMMIIGYGMIAVPTGIVTVELSRAGYSFKKTKCPACAAEGHIESAAFCYRCGGILKAK